MAPRTAAAATVELVVVVRIGARPCLGGHALLGSRRASPAPVEWLGILGAGGCPLVSLERLALLAGERYVVNE